MLAVFDKNRQKTGILENAFAMVETTRINSIYLFNFSLPITDPKNELCKPFSIVRYKDGEAYRIIGINLMQSELGQYTYDCEHVIAKLIDSVLFGYHVVGNLGIYTKDVINYALQRQTTNDWMLDKCEFNHQYEYGWEQESVLGAVFSVPNRFVDSYIWDFNTQNFPYQLSLKQLNTTANPSLYIRSGHNMVSLERPEISVNIATRLYLLGAGEGVNQVNVKAINNGLDYIQSPQHIIDKYGIITRIFTDRRFETAESLLQFGKKMLLELQEPYREYTVGFAEIDGDYTTAKLGGVVEIVDKETDTRIKSYIVGIDRNYDDILLSTLYIANKPQDIANTIADLADRQRIEQTYSQGATQLTMLSLQANADTRNGAMLNFFIPTEMLIINKVKIHVKLSGFRAYSQTAASNGGINQTLIGSTSSSTARTSTEDVDINTGGQTINVDIDDERSNVASWQNGTSSSARPIDWVELDYDIDGVLKTQRHRHDLERHYHKLNFDLRVPTSSERIRIPSQTLYVPIPAARVQLSVPPHTHNIVPGIYINGARPTAFTLFVNNINCGFFNSTDAEIDITDMLSRGGKITRGAWQEINIVPSNSLAYISIDMYMQGFIQSRGDKTV